MSQSQFQRYHKKGWISIPEQVNGSCIAINSFLPLTLLGVNALIRKNRHLLEKHRRNVQIKRRTCKQIYQNQRFKWKKWEARKRAPHSESIGTLDTEISKQFWILSMMTTRLLFSQLSVLNSVGNGNIAASIHWYFDTIHANAVTINVLVRLLPGQTHFLSVLCFESNQFLSLFHRRVRLFSSKSWTLHLFRSSGNFTYPIWINHCSYPNVQTPKCNISHDTHFSLTSLIFTFPFTPASAFRPNFDTRLRPFCKIELLKFPNST